MTDPDEAAIRARRARWIAAAMAGVSSTACQPSTGAEPPARAPAHAMSTNATTAKALPVPPHTQDDDDVEEAHARDTDKDGIRDFRDKCPDIPGVDEPPHEGCPPTPCLSIVPPTTPAILARIVFEAQRAKVRPDATAMLDEIAQAMTEQPTWTLRIVGHCRRDEPSSLAARRAEAVQRELEARGIAGERLETIGEACAPMGDPPPDATTVSFEILEPT